VSLLFSLRVPLSAYHIGRFLSGRTISDVSDVTLAVTVWEGPWQPPNHTRLDMRAILHWTENVGGVLKRKSRTIFKRGETWCGIPGQHSIDGKAAKEAVLSTLAMKPGDTDPDYFADYREVQLAFADAFGEELYMVKCDRYGEG